MKYVVFLGDGMADTPVEALGGKTPLAVAKKENIDALAPHSEIGLARTVPEGMKPGSDTANLAVMGYDPRTCYSGRSPLEALSMGLTLEDTDIAVRCNLVTLEGDDLDYADKTMKDYSAGEISTEEARELIAYINEKLGNDRISFHGGISYRHCLIVHDAETGTDLTPPHDITGKKITRHLPSGKLGNLFLDLEKASYDLLKDHPINLKRIAEGKNPANSVWFWGEGTKPALPDFYEKNGIHGAVISAVDLLKGIGKGAHMEVIDVEGATGNVNTDFAAKGRAAIDALKRLDYVYIHVEAPDESGHQGSLEDKITSIEKIDSDIVGPVIAYLRETGEPFRALVCPDHPTPLATRTHSADPIPYLLYKSDAEIESGVTKYDEENARSTGIFVEEGYTLIDRMLSADTEGNVEGISPDLITYTGEDGETVTLSEETAPAESAEGEAPADDADKKEETAEAKDEAPAPKKEKKPSAFGKFFKKHLKLFIIIFAVLLVAGGLVAGHFIATYHIAFISSEEDVAKALAKEEITRFVLKDNVTVSTDLAPDRAIDLDLNEYTLTVEGTLALSVSEDVYIGYRKSGEYVYGGRIVANNMTAVGTKDLYLYADLSVPTVTLTCGKLDLIGTVEGADSLLTVNASEANVSRNIEGRVDLSDACALTLSANAGYIHGGRRVDVTAGEVGTIEGSALVYVNENVRVQKVVNVDKYYIVKKLAAPAKVIVLNEDNEYYCYVSNVIDATALLYTVNDSAEASVSVTPGTTKFKLEGLTPGEQTLKIRATAEGDERYTDSDVVTCNFDFAVQLATPVARIKESETLDGKKIELEIDAVLYAEKYTYVIDGVAHTENATDGLVVDVTDDLQSGGVHVIEITAKSNDKYFTDSNVTLKSYTTTLTLPAPEVTVLKAEETVTFSWTAIPGTTYYLLHYDGDTIRITGTEITLPYAEGSAFDVFAYGEGYYLSSVTTVVSADAIATAIPSEAGETPPQED